MQSRLPDINTAFNTHRRKVIVSMDQEKFLDALGALYAINALLPIDYRVIISSKKYEELTKQDLSALCPNCQSVYDYSAVVSKRVITTPIMELIVGSKSMIMWECKRCKRQTSIDKTTFTQTILDKPYYLGVVPDPPKRNDGLADRFANTSRSKKWCWQMLYELEEKMAQYRDDNWTRTDDDFSMASSAPEESEQ